MRVIFTCGGTGGHINPAIAVANALRERHPDCEILFVGAAGEMEEDLVPRAGYKLIGLPSSSFERELSWWALKYNFRGIGRVASAIRACKKIIRDFRPDVIIGTGGYASFPALFVGSGMGIPTCVHESNAVPGLATKLVARRVNKIMVSFEESRKAYHHPERVEIVGMPVRREFIYTKREDARKELGIGPDEHLVVSAFGSLGARDMNNAVAELFCLEQKDHFPFRHIHATGSFGWEWMPAKIREMGIEPEKCPALDIREYIYNMPTVMAAADVIISRAGASSCNEIAASGTPAIIIPSPNVTNNHQYRNAKVYADRGAAVLIPESECTAQKLYDEIRELLAAPEKREQMRMALQNSVVPDSAEIICDILENLAKSK